MTQHCSDCRKTLTNGLGSQNPALVALLGLCPLLAVSTTAVNGLGLGLATMVTLLLTNLVISCCRQLIPEQVRLPIFVLLIASVVTIIEFLLSAFRYEFYQSVGLFIPLIVTNCVILARIEAVAYRKPVGVALLDGFSMGAGFALVLMVLGAMREIVGFGTLFAGAGQLFGGSADAWQLQVFDIDQGFLLAILPPGAFLGLALLVALKNWIEQRQNQNHSDGVLNKQTVTNPTR